MLEEFGVYEKVRASTRQYNRHNTLIRFMSMRSAWVDPEGRGGGGGAGGRHLKNHKNIGFLCNTSPDPLKLPSQHSILGHHRHASETPFQWRFAGGPILARL